MEPSRAPNSSGSLTFRPPRRPARARPHDDGDLWLISYGDLLTLLFCFFTLLLSVSTVDVTKVDAMTGEVGKQFGQQMSRSRLESLRGELQEVVKAAGITDQVTMRTSEEGLVVDLNARLLFKPGSSELSPQAAEVLTRVAAPLFKQPFDLQVEGHTDPLPIDGARFASNWELSSARASQVVRYLIRELGYQPDRLRVVGRADTQPVDEKGNPLTRQAPESQWTEPYLARQRRVTLVIRPSEQPVSTPQSPKKL